MGLARTWSGGWLCRIYRAFRWDFGRHGVRVQLTPCALDRLLTEATHRATGLSGLHVLLEDLAIDLCWGPVAPGPLRVDAQRVDRFLVRSEQ